MERVSRNDRERISALCDDWKRALARLFQERFSNLEGKAADRAFDRALTRLFETLLCKCWWGAARTGTGAPFSLREQFPAFWEAMRASGCFRKLFTLAWGVGPDAGLDMAVLDMVQEQITEHEGLRWMDIRHAGALFEELMDKHLLLEDGKADVVNSMNKKTDGVYFTDRSIVAFLVSAALEGYQDRSAEALFGLRIIDPAMGAGFFLTEMVDQLSGLIAAKSELAPAEIRRRVLCGCIYGIDKNPVAVDIAMFTLWLTELQGDEAFPELRSRLLAADSLLLVPPDRETEENRDLTRWSHLFPEVFGGAGTEQGFDIVIGNPPWGKIKTNVNSFLLNDAGTLAALPQGQAKRTYIEKDQRLQANWRQYYLDTSGYLRQLKGRGLYVHQRCEINGKTVGGDDDFYKFFVELAFQIAKGDGVVGLVVPAAFYLSESASGLRRLYLEHGCFSRLTGIINSRKLFPIHPSFKFVAFLYRKGAVGDAVCGARFDVKDPEELRTDRQDGVSYSMPFLRRYSGDFLTIPECKSPAEAALMERLCGVFPRLGERVEDGWNVSFLREVDMTGDKEQFLPREAFLRKRGAQRAQYVPVFEGRMVHQYDCSRKRYRSGSGRTAKWERNPRPGAPVTPQFYMKESQVPVDLSHFRACFCDVTGQHNVRTVLAALIPPHCVCGNKVPVCRFDREDIRLPLLWVALANSFVVDWLIRKRMTTTLNFFHWANVPFPRLSPDGEAARELIRDAARLLLQNAGMEALPGLLPGVCPAGGPAEPGRPLPPEAQEELRLRIDCRAAELFGLSPEELALILYAFPSLDNPRKGLPGDRKYGGVSTGCYVTRDKLLLAYLERRAPDDTRDVVELYRRAGVSIEDCTGPVRDLRERAARYEELGTVAYET